MYDVNRNRNISILNNLKNGKTEIVKSLNLKWQNTILKNKMLYYDCQIFKMKNNGKAVDN